MSGQRARPGQASTPLTRVDTQSYLDGVTSSDMFEIASSQLAIERSSNQRVKDFARKMVNDHQQASQRVTQALSTGGSNNLRAPGRMSAEHDRMLERLRGARGAAFDRMYLDMQVRGHERALALHRAYGNTGDNAALQGVAREMAPIVQQHLTEVRAIAGQRGQTKREKRGAGS